MNLTHEQLRLSLWSEVGKHLELRESLPVLAQGLAEAIALGALDLIERDAETGNLLLPVQWSPSGGVRRRTGAQVLTPSVLQAFEVWAARGEDWLARPGDPATPFAGAERLIPEAQCLAGPLCASGRVLGMLIATAPAATHYSEDDRSLFRAALAPWSAALENQARLHALRRLGAAADADRQALLSRLGRKSLSEVVVGAEQGLRGVMERVDQVASTQATVLILGETGSGKEVVARTIHERSSRRDGPFVRVNCGAVPAELIDSELFGHEKGSFTGALAPRRGWFERADGGTLFLDEIGELTPAVQIRLLRVLQDGIVQRVGSEREVAVNVRVIAATHRDLPGMVQEGHFREDLWYRIAVFPLLLPPLRERLPDIPLLARHFVERAASRLGVPTPSISEDDHRQLRLYRWPGNVRELSAVLERAVILGRGQRLELEAALGSEPRNVAAPVSAPPVPRPGDAVPDHRQDIAPLDEVLAAHLGRALLSCGGRIDGPHGAARLLRVNASTLRAKLLKYGVDAKAFRR